MLVNKMPMSLVLLCGVRVCAVSVFLGGLADSIADESRLNKDALIAIAKSTPRLDSRPNSPYRSFQFECRWTHILPDGKTGRVRCIVERHVNRQGLLVLSARGLPILQVNNAGMMGLSHEQPGELNYVQAGNFRFQCTTDQPIGSELGFGLARQSSQINVDIAGLIRQSLSQDYTLRWHEATRTLKIVNSDVTTSIRFRSRTEVGFPIESFSRVTPKGHGVVLTNFVVRAPYREGSCGPYFLTHYRRNPKGEHPSGVLRAAEAPDQWLRQVMSLKRIASAEHDRKLVEAAGRFESWIQLCSILQKRPIPDILKDDSIGPPAGFFPQQRWFKRLKFELTLAGAMPSVEVSRAPYRVDFIGYPRELSAAYVKAWLGYERTRRLYEFLIGVATDPRQQTYNRVGAISLLGRTGIPYGLSEIAELERRVAVTEPHVLACWSASRLILGALREQDMELANSTDQWSEWPWVVQTMAVHGLVNCGQEVDLKDWSDKFLTTAEKLGDGNLGGTDFITALAASKHGRRTLLEKVKNRSLGAIYTKTALLAVESSCEKGTKDRAELLGIAQDLALDGDTVADLRVIAANVAATGNVERAFVHKLLELVSRSEDVQLMMTLPLYAQNHLNELIDDHSGLPSLVRSRERRLRHAAADAISELPIHVSLTQDRVNTLLPTVGVLIENEDEAVVGLGIQALRRMFRPGIGFRRTLIEGLVDRTHDASSLTLFCGLIAMLDEISDETLLGEFVKPGESIPQPVGDGMNWWRLRRKAVLVAVDEWWKTYQHRLE